MNPRALAAAAAARVRRSGPFQRARKALTVVLPYRKMPGGRDVLDAQYTRGSWDYLWGAAELPRFSVVVGRCHELNPAARILEIGCGEGILRARMDRSRIARFVGVDLSREAIRRATEAGSDDSTAFVCADATTYVPDEQFDIVVFNECLEYFDDPIGVARRYEASLAEGGAFVVSMFAGRHTARTRRIWKGLDAAYRPADSTRVTNHAGDSWVIKTYHPGRAGGLDE